MSKHMIEKCEHGIMHAQCRCPAPDKTVKIVPCDPRVCPYGPTPSKKIIGK
jgi:hypothetical protein